MVTLARRVNRTPMAPVVGVMFGLVAAILVAAMPSWMFDRLVVQSGLPSILPFAAPPLGLTARVLAMALAAIVVGGILWLVIGLIEKTLSGKGKQLALWHDAGYAAVDEPLTVESRRRPIFAPAELGAPLMSDEAIATIRPLHDVVAHEPGDARTDPHIDDPAAVTAEVTAEVTADRTGEVIETAPVDSSVQAAIGQEPVSSWLASPIALPELTLEPELEVPLSATEFDLPPCDPRDEDDDSIQSLIRRLESGLARRAANDPGPASPTSAPVPLTLSKDWIVPDDAPLPPVPGDGTDGEDDDVRLALGTLQKFASR